MDKPLMELKGTNGTITAYENKVVISRKGVFAIASQGFKGDRTFFYNDLSGIDYKKPGWTNGYIKFLTPGTLGTSPRVSLMGSSPESMQDENTVILRAFNSDTPKLSEDMYNLLMEKINISKSGPANSTTSAFSSADEILKYKQLLDASIISQDEFENKKKQLLNI